MVDGPSGLFIDAYITNTLGGKTMFKRAKTGSRASGLKVVILLLLSVALIAGGCSSGSNGSSNEPSSAPGPTGESQSDGETSGPPTEFSYLRPVWGPATYTKGGAYEQELFKQANVKINVQIIPVTEYDTQAKTVIAAGNIPDVMWASGPLDPFWRDIENQGAFLKINDYLDKYPNVKATVSDSVWSAMQNENGEIFFFPFSIHPIVPFFTFYRADWFEESGIAEPTTIQELEQGLEKIKASKPDVVPMTVGLGGTEWMFKDLGTSFGNAAGGWMPSPEDPDQIVPSHMNPANIEYMFWLQDLKKRGLLDQEAGVNPDPAFGKQKFMTGRAAAYPGGYPDYLELLNAFKGDSSAKIGILAPLKGSGGQGGTRTVFPVDRGFYISAQTSDPEGIFRFLEWTLTEGQGDDFRRYGIEGKTYTVVDGKKVGIPEGEREADYAGSQIEPLKFLDPIDEKMNWDDWKTSFESQGFGEHFDYFKTSFEQYSDNQFPDYLNPTVFSPTNAEKGGILWEDYMAQMYGSILLDMNITRDNYNEALNKWLTNGGDKIIQEINDLQPDKSKPDYGV
jgi:putative aldouronate transport system substrate-binding protein